MEQIKSISAVSERAADEESKKTNSGILSPTRLLKPNTSAEFVSFSWNIEAFDCLAANGSDSLIRSQTFKCLQKTQLTEWYLSLDYSPHLPGHLRSGIFITTVNPKPFPHGEVKAHVSVFLTDSFGRPVLELGTVSRLFKAKDPVSVFRRFLDNESYMAVNEPRSECHEWFTPIKLKQLWGNKDILLSDNTLRIRCLLEVEAHEVQGSKSQHFPEFVHILRVADVVPCRTKTHISEHSIFNDHVVQHSDHSPYGSNAFGYRRPQTAHHYDSRPRRLQPQEPSANLRSVEHGHGTTGPSYYDPRPRTAVDMRKLMSKGPHDIVTSSRFPQYNDNPPRPRSPQAFHSPNSSDAVINISKTYRNLALQNLNMTAANRAPTRNVNQYFRPQTAAPLKYETQYNPNPRPRSAKSDMVQRYIDDITNSAPQDFPKSADNQYPNVELIYKAYRPETVRLEQTRNSHEDERQDTTRSRQTSSSRPRTRQPNTLPEPCLHDLDNLDISNTDCAIICGNKKFSVHQDILRHSSPVFATALNEAKRNAAQDSPACPFAVPTITSNDVEPTVMRKILNYVYSGEVEAKPESNPELPSKLTIDASRKLLHAANKYQISNLKEECLAKLLADLSLETVGEVAVLAYDFHANSSIKKKLKLFLRSKWIVLQRNPEFRELYKENPEAFAGVFTFNSDDENTDE